MWQVFLGDLVAADSKDDAQLAATMLVDELLPGGSIVADDGSLAVEAIARTPSFQLHDHRAYLIGVLGSVAQWVWVWRRKLRSGLVAPGVAEHAQWEQRTSDALAAALDELSWAFADEDPEVRSMIYRLTGAFSQGRDAGDHLQRSAFGEPHALARACAVAAGLEWLLHNPSVETSEQSEAWIRSMVTEGEVVVDRMLAVASAGHRTVDQVTYSTQILGSGLRAPRTRQKWPAETI